ncbi:hypothetical protein E2C01_075197 [Portunus trituberculatus]|uniref:Uncharacterized protein n=1 Tax=Portunus trituberculatus TaxID=210409 RepID=A0A5B7IJF3_PORTR|nr:hypothetical protein [Portunus trituberculatus]
MGLVRVNAHKVEQWQRVPCSRRFGVFVLIFRQEPGRSGSNMKAAQGGDLMVIPWLRCHQAS